MEKRKDSKDLTRASQPEMVRQGPHDVPDVDILDRGDELLVRADMPGVDPNGIDVRFENGFLSFGGKSKARESTGDALIQEFEGADFYRQFAIGEGIDESKISAEFE